MKRKLTVMVALLTTTILAGCNDVSVNKAAILTPVIYAAFGMAILAALIAIASNDRERRAVSAGVSACAAIVGLILGLMLAL